MAAQHPAEASLELGNAARAAAAGEFEHAIDHLIAALEAAGATAEVKSALEALAARVAEAGTGDPDVTGTLAGLFADTGEMAQAVAWARRTHDLAPQARTSRAQVLAFTYMSDRDIEQLVQLADLVNEEPDADDVARRLFAACCRGTMWLGFVPAPTDSLVDLTHNLLASGDYTPDPDGRYDAPLVLKMSAPESPSAAVAFSALFPQAQFTVVEVPEPDIRRPLVEGLAHRLWDYQGTTPVARYPEPSPKAVALLQRVAAKRWGDPLAVYRESAAFAELEEQDLFSLLVHVPPAPEAEPWAKLARHNPLYWPRIAQAWVCLGWLHVRPEEPWAASTRRRVLGDLLFGADDWTVDAAANALATAAWNRPETRAEIFSILMPRTLAAIEASSTRASELIEPLCELVLSAPGGDPRLRGSVGDILAKYRALEEPETPEEFTPDAIRQWGQGVAAEHDAREPAKTDKKARRWLRGRSS